MKPKTIFRAASRTVPYTQIARTMLQDSTLSMEARGLLCFVLSLPDNWTFHLNWLCKDQKIGRDRAQRLVRELLANGYCVRHQDRLPDGRMGPFEYWFSDDPAMIVDGASPQPENPVAVTQDVVHRDLKSPRPVKPAPVNPPLQTRQSTSNKQVKEKDLHTRARDAGTDGTAAKTLPFTPAVLAEIARLGLDVDETLTNYAKRTKGRVIRDPNAYLLRMARDQLAKRAGVSVEQVAKMTSRNRDERVQAAVDATGAFSKPSDAAIARARNCSSLNEILADMATRRFATQEACDREFQGHVVNARFRPHGQSFVANTQLLKNGGQS